MEQHPDIKYEEEFIINSSGLKLFTCRWLPVNQEAKAIICLCHDIESSEKIAGYGMECSIFMQDTGVRLARAGYGVFGIDYQGHGKSQGKRGYVHSFQDVVNDCASFFKTIMESKVSVWGIYGRRYGASDSQETTYLLERCSPPCSNV
eukprot:Gb_01008 [translate_table: standard]